MTHAGIKALVHEAQFADRVPTVGDDNALTARSAVGGDVEGSRPYAELKQDAADLAALWSSLKRTP